MHLLRILSSISRLFSHLVLMFVLISGCASVPRLGSEGKNNSQPYLLSLKVHVDEQTSEPTRHTEVSSIDLKTKTLFYQRDKLARKSSRRLKLKLQSVMEWSDDEEVLLVENKILEKQGEHNLHDLGFPNMGESLYLKMNRSGRILEVEQYDEDSIFYLPPILLPDYEVRIGDTWKEKFYWSGESYPNRLKTEIECRLAGLEKWEGRNVFKIEMVSNSKLAKESPLFNLTSRSTGYVYWDNEKGIVAYAKNHGKDTFTSKRTQHSYVIDTQIISRNIPKPTQ